MPPNPPVDPVFSPWRLSVAPMMDWTDELLSTYCSKPFADVAVWIALQLHFEG